MRNLRKDTTTNVTRSIRPEYSAVSFLLLFFIFTAAGCQDHHWVPYEKMGPVAKQTNTPPSKEADFLGAEVIVSGKVELDKAEKADNFKDFTLYIIVRSTGKNSILAATKAVNVKFPYVFSVTDQNVMFGELDPKASYMVQARFDSDGNPDTKNENDLSGAHDGDLSLGAENASILLVRKKG